jgi:hypothetical protein
MRRPIVTAAMSLNAGSQCSALRAAARKPPAALRDGPAQRTNDTGVPLFISAR